ncbi:MAG: hypothetical protein NT068_01730 [Candidatus Nomurabacteria bacterium]|nr:hypothetical protein [Candidatus Nomurabacteria bacterium]
MIATAIVVVISGCIKSHPKAQTNYTDSTIVIQPPVSQKVLLENKAQEVITRAIWFCGYIPDSNSRKVIISGLSRLKVVTADKSGSTQLDSSHFFLLIDDAMNLDSGRALFKFNSDEFVKNGRIIIVMNDNIMNISNDLDAEATVLIHEFVHTVQMNDRVIFGKNTTLTSAEFYEDEDNAWSSQVYLYSQVHQEINIISCNCDQLTINLSPEQIDRMDILVKNSILYGHCGEKFLKTFYKK